MVVMCSRSTRVVVESFPSSIISGCAKEPDVVSEDVPSESRDVILGKGLATQGKGCGRTALYPSPKPIPAARIMRTPGSGRGAIIAVNGTPFRKRLATGAGVQGPYDVRRPFIPWFGIYSMPYHLFSCSYSGGFRWIQCRVRGRFTPLGRARP